MIVEINLSCKHCKDWQTGKWLLSESEISFIIKSWKKLRHHCKKRKKNYKWDIVVKIKED